MSVRTHDCLLWYARNVSYPYTPSEAGLITDIVEIVELNNFLSPLAES